MIITLKIAPDNNGERSKTYPFVLSAEHSEVYRRMFPINCSDLWFDTICSKFRKSLTTNGFKKKLLKKAGFVLTIIIMFSTCWSMSGESFVQPKKKTTSANTLKQDCGDLCASILEQTSSLLNSLGSTQKTVLRAGSDLLEGSKNSFFGKASKEQLQQYQDELSALEQELSRMHKQINQRVKRLQELAASY